MKEVKSFARFMIDNGILFEINRKVLHPLGLAMVIDVDPQSRKKLTIRGLFETEDVEGFVFDKETYDFGKEVYEKYVEKKARKKFEARQLKFGFIEQDREA